VYKESLEEVIKPTFASVKPAMDAYRKIGGQVKMLICDDGLQARLRPCRFFQ
jgi:predicted peroxiredoxin